MLGDRVDPGSAFRTARSPARTAKPELQPLWPLRPWPELAAFAIDGCAPSEDRVRRPVGGGWGGVGARRYFASWAVSKDEVGPLVQ